tara:strand:+ start:696 stop:1058 length:363 start_codon:yes stop_codon:yes gene_type:complete
MAYDEYLGDRIRQTLNEKQVHFTELKMMGGLCFKVEEKMICGIHIDKKYGDSLLMLRIGEDEYKIQIDKEECLPMDFTGRPMKGYVYVIPDGFDTDENLSYWLGLAILYNPFAKASKKKK